METYALYQRLVALRRRNPWLVAARLTTSDVTNDTMRIALAGPGGEQLVLVLNTADEPAVVGGVAVGAHDFAVVEG